MSTTITQQTTNVQVRMERDLKHEAERVLEDLGLSLSDGVRVFFKQLVLHKGIPFTLMTKNNVTASDTLLTEKHEKHLNGLSQELEKAKKENSAYTAHSVDDMMDVLQKKNRFLKHAGKLKEKDADIMLKEIASSRKNNKT